MKYGELFWQMGYCTRTVYYALKDTIVYGRIINLFPRLGRYNFKGEGCERSIANHTLGNENSLCLEFQIEFDTFIFLDYKISNSRAYTVYIEHMPVHLKCFKSDAV